MINFLAIDCSLSTGQIFLKKHHSTFLKKIQSTKYLNDILNVQISDTTKHKTFVTCWTCHHGKTTPEHVRPEK